MPPTRRRTFTALLAASAVALPRFSFEQAKATAAGIAGPKLIAYADASHGIVATKRDHVTGDLHNFLAS